MARQGVVRSVRRTNDGKARVAISSRQRDLVILSVVDIAQLRPGLVIAYGTKAAAIKARNGTITPLEFAKA